MIKPLLLSAVLWTMLPASAHAAAPSLYERMQKETLREMFLDTDKKPAVEEVIADFVIKIMAPGDPPLTREIVISAMRRDTPAFCKAISTEKTFDIGFCASYMERVRSAAIAEQKIRTLGRDLQRIAASYELPVDGYPGRITQLPSRYKSLVNLWKAGQTDLSSNKMPSIRVHPLPDKKNEAWKTIVQELKEMLGKLSAEEQTAAVWRYQHGKRFVTGERGEYPAPPSVADAASGPGTEGQYLFKRWNGNGTENVEGALQRLWTHLKADTLTIDPPLVAGDIIFYPEVDLGDDLIGWAFLEMIPPKTVGGALGISGDAGLQWKHPLSPVLPSLFADFDGSGFGEGYPVEEICNQTQPGNTSCPAILGGTYPPEPRDGAGLCAFPFGRLGYLCRPMEQTTQGATCDPTSATDGPPSDKIVLTHCETGTERLTDSGPNVCREILWQTPPEDTAVGRATAQSCKDCTVSFECKETCGFTKVGNIITADLTTPIKKANGEIKICIGKNEVLPPKYRVMHDLILSQRICHAAPGSLVYPKDNAGCCAAEIDAFSATCDAMVQDGIFRDAAVTPEDCTRYFANAACKKTVNALCRAPVPTDMQALITRSISRNATPTTTPSCNEVKDPTWRVDPRVTALRQNLSNVCNPECQTSYANTIGNAMCYVGQCVEQAFESHRMIPGRNTFVSGDEAYPFDACAAPDPSFATLLTPPPLTATWFPAYRPAWLLRTLDNALCQINGLPPQSAAILCETNALRRLSAPLENPVETIQHLINQIAERRRPAEQLERLAPGLGARMGTTLYVNYLRLAGRSLGEITSIAAELLGNMKDIQFPTDMCPREGSQKNALRLSPQCAAIGDSPSPE